MAEYPALPLWTDAYLSDTGHLTDAEHGIYLQLLILIWRSPECRIPNDKAWIARRFRRPIENVEETVMPIINEFCKSDGNFITQGRLLDEWNFVRKRSKSQSARAKSRWNKEKKVSRSDAGAMPDECPTDAPTPTPTPTDSVSNDTAKNGHEDFFEGGEEARKRIAELHAAKKDLFDTAVRVFAGANVAEYRTRQMIGTWLKKNSIEEVKAAIETTEISGAVEPLAYTSGILKKRGTKLSKADLEEINQVFAGGGA